MKALPSWMVTFGSATIEVFAPSLTVGARATLRIGVNWGPHFIYEYALKAK